MRARVIALLRRAIHAVCQHQKLVVNQASKLGGGLTATAFCLDCGESWRDDGTGASICNRAEAA